MPTWICKGVAKDGQQHPNQNPPGLHEPYENFGSDCVFCRLTKEQVEGSSSKPPVKAIAGAAVAGILAAIGFGAYKLLVPQPIEPEVTQISAPPTPPPEEPTSLCSTSVLKKQGTLFSAIEVGSKGVKGKVIQELPTPNEDGQNLILFRKEKIEERNVTPFKPESKADTVEAVKGMFQEIQKRFNIPCEQIVIYGSSGVAEKLPDADKEVLVKEIQQVTGRTMEFITPEKEASLAFDGVVPEWRLHEVTLIDIGAGNTKGTYLDSKDKHIPFSIPFGTGSFTEEIEDSKGNLDFVKAAEKEKQEKLIPLIFGEVQRKPGMKALPRVYLAGGISWALFTLTRPCSQEFGVIGKRQERFDSFAPITSEDINTFYFNTTKDPKTLFDPNLTNCSAERREEVQKEIAKIQKDIFTKENLIAGAEILRSFNEQLDFSKKQVFFVRSAQDAIPIGYIKQQLENAE